jgi:hypothetical protein
MGLIGGILQTVYHGAFCYLMSPVAFLQNPARWLRAVSRYRADTSGGPNFAYDLCVPPVTPDECAGRDLSRWSVAAVGAEPVSAATLARPAETAETFQARRADTGEGPFLRTGDAIGPRRAAAGRRRSIGRRHWRGAARGGDAESKVSVQGPTVRACARRAP